ncbi:MAG: Large-conductance mechanosensitive channel [Actinobacteria bacterium ADurb.Bin444]|jgi:large conductance mechanosensitive channel|nr:MAG: Large-conductance mechanosensitive channel [Actinobacteria bacterium ADurb.Bin444]
MFKEFREFALKGSLLDFAVGIILGSAFAGLVNSFVADVLMPPIGLIWGRDFTNLFAVLKEGADGAAPYASLQAAQDAGAVTLNYGAFINLVITFIIVAIVLFFLVKGFNHLRRTKEEVTTKDCPYCLTAVPLEATRCPACTSELGAKP